jgi:hypothetical protein
MRLWVIPWLLFALAVAWALRRFGVRSPSPGQRGSSETAGESVGTISSTPSGDEAGPDSPESQSGNDDDDVVSHRKGRWVRASIYFVACITTAAFAIFFYREGTANPSEQRRPGLIAVLLSKQAQASYDIRLDVWVSDIFTAPQAAVHASFERKKGAAARLPRVEYAILVAGTADGPVPAYVGQTKATSIRLKGWCPESEYCSAPAHVTVGSNDPDKGSSVQFHYPISRDILTKGSTSGVVTLPALGLTASLQPDPVTFKIVPVPELKAPKEYYGADHTEVSLQAAPVSLADDLDKIDPATPLDTELSRFVWTLKNIHPRIPKLVAVLKSPAMVYEDKVLNPGQKGPVPVYDSAPQSPLPLKATFRISRQAWKEDAQNQLFYSGLASAVATGLLVALVQVFVDWPRALRLRRRRQAPTT